jgi:3-dehydroquinate synthetase
MQADKKRRAGRLRFVLPRDIGDVEYGVVVPERKVHGVLTRLSELPGGHEFR